MKLGFDILFLIAIGGSAVGCFFLGDERSQRLMLGSLVGVFAATALAAPLAKLAGDNGLLNITNISFMIVIVSILVSVLPKRLRDKKWPKNKPRAAISGLLSALFLLSYGITFLPLATKTTLVTDHNLAAMFYDLRLFTLGALVVWLFVTMVFVGKAKR